MPQFQNDGRFRIFIKANGHSDWHEIGYNGKTIVSTNYQSPSNDTTDAGMKINTTTTFTADKDDRICIITHTDSGSTISNYVHTNFRIVRANWQNIGTGGSTKEDNPKLKYCMCDRIEIMPVDIMGIFTGEVNIPHDGTGISKMEANGAGDTTIAGSMGSANGGLYLFIGRNNMGWNVAITDGNYGMGAQGNIRWPDITKTDSTEVDDSDNWSTKDAPEGSKAVNFKEICQPVNLATAERSGFTMVGWYKSPLYTNLKLIDPYNIVEKLYYYNGTTYVDMTTDTRVTGGSANTWNGPSSDAGNGGVRAQAFNIFTDGYTAGVWVKVTKTITDFDMAGGFGNPTGTPTAPWVHLCYK